MSQKVSCCPSISNIPLVQKAKQNPIPTALYAIAAAIVIVLLVAKILSPDAKLILGCSVVGAHVIVGIIYINATSIKQSKAPTPTIASPTPIASPVAPTMYTIEKLIDELNTQGLKKGRCASLKDLFDHPDEHVTLSECDGAWYMKLKNQSDEMLVLEFRQVDSSAKLTLWSSASQVAARGVNYNDLSLREINLCAPISNRLFTYEILQSIFTSQHPLKPI